MFVASLNPPSLSVPMTGEQFVFLGSARGSAGVFTFRWTLAPGKKGPPEHTHPDETESFEVISGTLRIWIDGRPHDLGPGMKLSVPPGTPHRFLNPGKEPVVVKVSLDGTRMEDAFIPQVLFFAGRKPRVSEMFRVLVHEADYEATRATSPVARGITALFVGVARRFGVGGFPPARDWEPTTTEAQAA